MARRIAVPVSDQVPGGTTNAYLLGTPPILVDPAAGPDVLDIDPRAIEHLIATHAHPDHVGGMAAFARQSDATVWALPHHRERLRDATGLEPDRTIRGGEEIAETGVRVLETPGHTPDHLALVDGTDVLVGDLARADGSVMVGAPEGDMRAYLSSLRRLLVQEFDRALPGHGPPIDRPAERFAALLAHRLEREAKVETAVAGGATTVPEIVERAYDKDLHGVRAAAERTVAAHLEKLAVEGRVNWDGERPSPVE